MNDVFDVPGFTADFYYLYMFWMLLFYLIGPCLESIRIGAGYKYYKNK